jgi:hypothetical protein
MTRCEAADHDRETTVEMQKQAAQLVEQFNRLIDERRYAEAEVSPSAHEISPTMRLPRCW